MPGKPAFEDRSALVRRLSDQLKPSPLEPTNDNLLAGTFNDARYGTKLDDTVTCGKDRPRPLVEICPTEGALATPLLPPPVVEALAGDDLPFAWFGLLPLLISLIALAPKLTRLANGVAGVAPSLFAVSSSTAHSSILSFPDPRLSFLPRNEPNDEDAVPVLLRPNVVNESLRRCACAAAVVIGPGYEFGGLLLLLSPVVLEIELRPEPKISASVWPAKEERRVRGGELFGSSAMITEFDCSVSLQYG